MNKQTLLVVLLIFSAFYTVQAMDETADKPQQIDVEQLRAESRSFPARFQMLSRENELLGLEILARDNELRARAMNAEIDLPQAKTKLRPFQVKHQILLRENALLTNSLNNSALDPRYRQDCQQALLYNLGGMIEVRRAMCQYPDMKSLQGATIRLASVIAERQAELAQIYGGLKDNDSEKQKLFCAVALVRLVDEMQQIKIFVGAKQRLEDEIQDMESGSSLVLRKRTKTL